MSEQSSMEKLRIAVGLIPEITAETSKYKAYFGTFSEHNNEKWQAIIAALEIMKPIAEGTHVMVHVNEDYRNWRKAQAEKLFEEPTP